MSKRKLSLGEVDVSSLETEDDFQREAERLLPRALEEMGRFAGETAWESMRKAFHGSVLKMSKSSGDKRKFIEQSAKEYKQSATSEDKHEILDAIIAQLREMKAREE